LPDAGPVLIRVPRDHERLRAERPALARTWRDPLAEAIEACVASGRIARRFTRETAYVFA
jgi:predicted GNAT superfamily acetyltransferase